MNFVRRMTAGRGKLSRSDRTTLSWSASTISALPSIKRRSARRIGTIVSGSYDALSARQPTITQILQGPVHELPPRYGAGAATSKRHRAPRTRKGTRGKVLHSQATGVHESRQDRGSG